MMKTIKTNLIALCASLVLTTAYASNENTSNNSKPIVKPDIKSSIQISPEKNLSREEKIEAMVKANEKKEQLKKATMQNDRQKNRIMKKNCTMAKSRLEYLVTTPRIRTKQTDGSARMMSTEEKAKEIKEARQAIKRYCQQN